MVMVWVQLVRRISQQNVQENEGNSFYFRKMYGVVNLVGPEVQPSIGNVKHGPLRLPISIDGARIQNLNAAQIYWEFGMDPLSIFAYHDECREKVRSPPTTL